MAEAEGPRRTTTSNSSFGLVLTRCLAGGARARLLGRAGEDLACEAVAHAVVSTRERRLEDDEIYAAVGEEGFHRLVAAFYRQVPADDILGAMYPAADLPGAEERLRDFLVGRFGGPPRYVEQRGHPRLRMRHLPFAITAEARDRWLRLMTRALDEVRFPPPADDILRRFFAEVATMMINRG